MLVPVRRQSACLALACLGLEFGCSTEPPAPAVDGSAPEIVRPTGRSDATKRLEREDPEDDASDPGLTRAAPPEGAGFGGRGRRVPRTPYAGAIVGAGIDREVVRGVIRAHINDVRACYPGDAMADGRVAIAFEIDPSGRVARSEVRESTAKSSATETCIMAAIERWRFPKPEGGVSVEVVYPFNLVSG